MRTLGLVVVALLGCVLAEDVPQEVTIDAAFRNDDSDIILISGDHYVGVTPEGFQRYHRARGGASGVPSTEPLQAAIRWPWREMVYFFGEDIGFKSNLTSMTSEPIQYGKYRLFLQNGGPDAGAFRSGLFYIFRGCQYVAQKATLSKLGEPQDISELGLPCDVDAAWTDADFKGMTILKGDLIWRWEDEVTGPERFDSVYHLVSWQLTPRPEDRYTM